MEITDSKDAKPMIVSATTSYMNRVNKFPLLTEAEEKKLTKEFYETKSPKLAEKLVNHNLRLVVKIVHEYRTSPDNLLDLIQEGNFGLVRGVAKFNPEHGVPLAHYCGPWIRAYVLRYILNNSRLVKIGTTDAQRKLFYNLSKEMSKLNAQGIVPTDSEIANNLSVSEKDVTEMKIRLAPEASLDVAPRGDDSGERPSRMETLEAEGCAPDEALERAQEEQIIRNQFNNFRSTLKGIDVMVFDRRLMLDDPETFESIGLALGVSRQWVQQVEVKVKKKLKDFVQMQS